MFFQILKRKESLLFLVLFIAGLSLWGWLFGKIAFASFSLKYIPIAPSTAVMFIALCILYLSNTYFERSRFVKSIVTPLVLFVALFCLVIFLDYIFNFIWDIENIFITDPESLGNLPKGRMSPITSLLFISTCIGILGIKQNNPTIIKYIGGGFSLTVFLVSAVLLIGYLYNTPLLYGSQIIPVALPTAICLLLFSITLLRVCEVQYWTFNLIKDNTVTRQLLNWFLPIIIFIVILQGFLITDFSFNNKSPVLTASIILLIIIVITIVTVIRVSVILGTRILKVEKALSSSEENYRSLTENIGEGVGFLNDKETFIYVNPAAEKIFGVDKGELSGLCLNDFLVGENIQIVKNETQKRRQGESTVFEHEIVLKDGSKKHILATATPSFYDKIFIGTFAIFRDITERKRADEEIRHKNKELHILNAEKDKFFSIIAHDLRSPFNGFLGLTQIMAEELPTMTLEQTQKIAVRMRKSATNLYSLLENLLEWSRLQRGVTAFSPASFLLIQKISEHMAGLLEAARNKEIDISYNIPKDLVVFTDENMLGGIIRNLTSNAVKFTPKGGKVIIAAKPVSDNLVEISIKDTGIGMNQEMLGNLFQLDINTNRKGTDNEPSTGLGLIICKDFIEKHDGKLWVESEDGKGSKFYFTLPSKKAETPKQEKVDLN